MVLGIGKRVRQIKAGLKIRKGALNLFKTEGLMTQVTVPVKSALKSKINAGALALLVVGVLQFFGLDISDETKETLGAAVGQIADLFVTVVVPALIIIWRTWFNNSATPNAVK